jgi:hypothetical protein
VSRGRFCRVSRGRFCRVSRGRFCRVCRGRFCRVSRGHLGRIGREQRGVKAPGLSTNGRGTLSRAFVRRLTKTSGPRCALPSRARVASLRALVQSSVVGRHRSRPTAGETSGLALSPALCAGFQRDLRSRPSYVGRAGSRGRPRSVPPESATHRVATGRHPASRLSVRNSVVAVLPTPPRLLATELRIGPHGVRTRFGSGRQQIASSRRSE